MSSQYPAERVSPSAAARTAQKSRRLNALLPEPAVFDRRVIDPSGFGNPTRSEDREFLPFIAHELRNSLSVVRNAAYRLRDVAIPASALISSRMMIERHLELMSGLVDHLLTASRDEYAAVHVVLERVDLNAVVAQSVQAVEASVRQRKQTLTASATGAPIWVIGDSTRLEQVFFNLLSNASKYSEEGGTIRLTVAQEAGGAVVRVLDNGIGIEPQLLPNVFKLFVRATPSDRPAPVGSGVGLALVRSIVDAHGGSVGAISAGIGTGSEFAVWLPCVSDRVSTGHC